MHSWHYIKQPGLHLRFVHKTKKKTEMQTHMETWKDQFSFQTRLEQHVYNHANMTTYRCVGLRSCDEERENRG